MKRFVLTIAFCLAYVSLANAAPFRSVVNAKNTSKNTTIVVASTTTAYTVAIDSKYIKNNEDTGILYRATSDGAVDLRLDMQISFKPSVDGAADTDYLDSHVIDTSITDEVWHLATLDTVILPYLRFKVTGQGSNHASTTIEIKVSK